MPPPPPPQVEQTLVSKAFVVGSVEAENETSVVGTGATSNVDIGGTSTSVDGIGGPKVGVDGIANSSVDETSTDGIGGAKTLDKDATSAVGTIWEGRGKNGEALELRESDVSGMALSEAVSVQV